MQYKQDIRERIIRELLLEFALTGNPDILLSIKRL